MVPANGISLPRMRADARRIFDAGVQAVDPWSAVRRHFRREGRNLRIGDTHFDLENIEDIVVVGAGKASAAMARAVEDTLADRITRGSINVKYGHSVDLKHIRIVECGHPVPDENGTKGSADILELVSSAGAGDLIICLISGGGSALMPLPMAPVTLADKQETTRILLSCGATIHEINSVRKHLSSIKGGLLCRAAHPARVATLILSDVVGDDLDVIASGPTVPDTSTFDRCLSIFETYNILGRIPDRVHRHIRAGAAGDVPETPKTGESIFRGVTNTVIGNNQRAVEAARHRADGLGYGAMVLSTLMEGETREVAKVHAAIARQIVHSGTPLPAPACILSGGETTVTLSGAGKGGRNQEFALAAALDIAGYGNIVILSGGTDGTDGPTDAAGAIVDGATRARATALGLDPRHFLANNDAYPFFRALDDLLITGPTGTNVMDLHIMLVS